MRRVHDMGGLPAGPIDRDEHPLEPWEKQVDAIVRLLVGNGTITLDELRRAIEDLGEAAYDRLSYFERWIAAVANLLLEKRIVTPRELGAEIADAHRRHAGPPA